MDIFFNVPQVPSAMQSPSSCWSHYRQTCYRNKPWEGLVAQQWTSQQLAFHVNSWDVDGILQDLWGFPGTILVKCHKPLI